MNKILTIIFLLSSIIPVFSQTSIAETSGLWVDNASWVGGTPPPTSAANIQNVVIDGFIRREGSIISTSNFGLTVQAGDTLVVTGDLNINNGNLTVNNGSVVVIFGDVSGSNFNISLNTGGSVVFAGAEASISGITTNGDGNLYVFDTTPTISGNANGANGIEDESDLNNNNPDLADFVTGGGVLPVELIAFRATNQDNGILLTWVTASEINNDFFEVQKSSDGLSFETIGKVDGFGNSDIIRTYNYNDSRPHFGANYYRLRQVDFDGAFEYSGVIFAYKRSETQKSIIYSELNTNEVKILFSPSFVDTPSVIKLHDMKGRLVWKESMIAPETMDLSFPQSMQPGIYILNVQNNNELLSQKVIFR